MNHEWALGEKRMGQVGKLGQARGISAHWGGEQNQGSRGRGKGVWGRKTGMGGLRCHGTHLVPRMPWLGPIQTCRWGALISTLGAVPATQLLKNPPQVALPRGGGGSVPSPPADLGWERGPAWGKLGAMNVQGLSFPTLCREPGGVCVWETQCLLPLGLHTHVHTQGTHTSVPRGVGLCLCVTLHHMPGVLLLGQLRGDRGQCPTAWGRRTGPMGVGERPEEWERGGSRRALHKHVSRSKCNLSCWGGWGGAPRQLCSRGCSRHPQVGGSSPQRWSA